MLTEQWVPTEWMHRGEIGRTAVPVVIERMCRPFFARDGYLVRCGQKLWSPTDKAFVDDDDPEARDDGLYDRCAFATFEGAAAVATDMAGVTYEKAQRLLDALFGDAAEDDDAEAR